MAMVHVFADPAVIRPTRLNRAFIPQVFEQHRQVFLDRNGHFLGILRAFFLTDTLNMVHCNQ
jgi:hypothetical protein